MYKNLEAELARNDISRADVAKALGVALATASEKLNKKGRMKLDEAFTIKNTFFPDLSLNYLFAEIADTSRH